MSHRRPLRQGQLSTFQTLKGQWVWSLMKGAGAAGGHGEGGQGFRKRYKAIPYPQEQWETTEFLCGCYTSSDFRFKGSRWQLGRKFIVGRRSGKGNSKKVVEQSRRSWLGPGSGHRISF